nr:TPA_asm: IAP [Mytilus Mediterranean mussel adintovirus]
MDLDSHLLDLFCFNPLHPHMLYYITRQQTYKDWPTQLAQKPADLIRNGFYYTNVGDRVTCFCCGVTLKQWKSSDHIETEHLKYEPNCLFAKMVSTKVPNFNA